MWCELVESVCSECTFAPPGDEQSLNDIEAALPPELRALLLESNGIGGDCAIMPVERMITVNLELRSFPEHDDLYMPFDNLLCFGSPGNGDMFFFPVQSNGKVNNPDIFLWNHEDDSRTWIANNLEQFVTKWYAGQWKL